ncbi:MAG: NAD(P)/FAD-dependent oxidoreductase [Candidatus Omnitrophica bacterium]|nr:NAD(P)/FAD-dependent oxidoreductase [Candidatus Omnitrophota bacterium]
MTKNYIYDAIVIGAGPSGLICAGRAAERGLKVLLLEKNAACGRKLLISGKGRCNFTNAGDIDKFLAEFSKSGIFLRNAFSRFFNKELCAFFEKRGVKVKIERGGRIFPASDRAKDILSALIGYIKANKVILKLNAAARDISAKEGYFLVETEEGKYFANKVVVATGGLSYPETGSEGFGFKIAQKFGHNVIEPKPGLVGLVIREDIPRRLQGLSLENVEVSLLSENKTCEKRFGDMLFTHYGLCGPIILDLSNQAVDLLRQGRSVSVSIDLKPALDFVKLDSRLLREFNSCPNKTLKNIFVELLPRKFIIEFLKYCNIDGNIKANQVTKEMRQRLIKSLFDFKLSIIKARPIEEAIVTRGGVDTKEINPQTMESRIIKNLYFIGELIDVDAKTGGYNLQAAFSTGYVCADNL